MKKLKSWGPWSNNPSKRINFYEEKLEENLEENLEEKTDEVVSNILEPKNPYDDILKDL